MSSDKKYEKMDLAAKTIAAIISDVLGIDITLCPKCRKGHCHQNKVILKKPIRIFDLAA